METERSNPYVGPRTFEEQDSGYFFGRDEEAKALRSLVLGHRLVLFYATSGAGKSSLINARIIPDLRNEQYTPLRARVSSGQQPEALAAADNPYVFNLLANLSPEAPAEELQHLTLTEYLETHHQIPDAEEESFLDPARILIIDQFEEIVTTNEMYWKKRTEFFRQLNTAMSRDKLLWVLLVMREDYVTELEAYAHLLPGKLKVRYHMERMREHAALQALKAPALKAGRPYYEGQGGLPGSAEMLLWDLRQVRVAGRDRTVTGQFVEPVQLQLVCYSLWEELRGRPGEVISAADIEVAANVDNTLGDYYDGAIRRIIEQTAVEERALRSWFGDHLITETDTRGLVFRGDTHTEGMDNSVIDFLDSQFFLLRSSTIGGGAWYELVHDRFIPAIRQSNEEAWTRLERQKRHEALAAQKQSFEQDRRKLMRRVLLFVVPATVIITILWIAVLVQRNQKLVDANEQKQVALEGEKAAAGTAEANYVAAQAAVTLAAEALEREEAAGEVAEENYHAAQTAIALAAEDATQAALLEAERNVLLEQQKQSLVEQSTRLHDSQATQTAIYQAPVEGDSTSPVATANPTRALEEAATATALVAQLAAVEATQTAAASKSEQEAVSATQTVSSAHSAVIISTSVNGQPIEVRRFGSGAKHLVFVGGIHAGASPNSVQLAEAAATWFAENRDAIPASLTVWVVTNMNPDSVYAPGQIEGRFNANGVDLNRNWDCNWNPNPVIRGERRLAAGGREPFSEPENQALVSFFERVRPEAVVFWGAAASGGLTVPGGCPAVNERGGVLAQAYGQATGYRYSGSDIGEIEGDATNWLDTIGVPGFFVLLPDVWRTDWETNLPGILNLMEMVSEQ